MNERMEYEKWVVTEILKKMEQLEFCINVVSSYVETLEDKMESIQQEFISFTDAAEELQDEIQKLSEGLGVVTC